MRRRPPRSTRTDTLFPYTTLFRSTFHYPSGAWLRTSLYSAEWPDLARVLDRDHNAQPIPEGFFDAVTRLDAFADKSNRLHLRRSEEHTSELQSLMRISYAVFCLQKKKKQQTINTNKQ